MAQQWWRGRLQRLQQLADEAVWREKRSCINQHRSARMIQRAWWRFSVAVVSKRVHFRRRRKEKLDASVIVRPFAAPPPRQRFGEDPSRLLSVTMAPNLSKRRFKMAAKKQFAERRTDARTLFRAWRRFAVLQIDIRSKSRAMGVVSCRPRSCLRVHMMARCAVC
jgi:hypothetical protein